MEAVSQGARPDVARRRQHRARRLPRRRRHQPGLCAQELPRHLGHRTRHRFHLHGQGERDVPAGGEAFADRQRDHRRQPAANVRHDRPPEPRFLRQPALDRTACAPGHRSRGCQHNHQPSRRGHRPRPARADRPADRDDRAGPGDVVLQLHRGAAGALLPAQDDPAHFQHRQAPVHRRRAHPGNDAGDRAGHSDREGLYARRHDASTAFGGHRRPRTRVRTAGRVPLIAPVR